MIFLSIYLREKDFEVILPKVKQQAFIADLFACSGDRWGRRTLESNLSRLDNSVCEDELSKLGR